jgi:hypothetical protein
VVICILTSPLKKSLIVSRFFEASREEGEILILTK